jgi:hypothetical protein
MLYLVVLCVFLFFTTVPDSFAQKDTAGNLNIKQVNLEIIPPSSGIQIYRDGIIFLSSTRSSGRMVTDHVSFGKMLIRYAEMNDTVPGTSRLLSPEFDFPFPAEATAFSNDFRTLYFTRYSEKEKSVKIFKAELIDFPDGKTDWMISDNPLSFCQGKSTYTHPALSSDGKVMVFASDKAGSFGGMDLYISRFDGKEWSQPENLGNEINSASDELFPCIDNTGNLFFSSNRRPGLGGHDLFFSQHEKDNWRTPVNIGSPVNTSHDDIAFTIDKKDGLNAYYSVRRKNRPVQLFRILHNSKENNFTLSEAITGIRKEELLAQNQPVPETPKKEVIALNQPNTVKDTATSKAQAKVVKPGVVKQPENRPVVKKEEPKPAQVIYRVQLLSSMKPKGSYILKIGDKSYNTFEYNHAGAYRTCVGELTTFKAAMEFQNLCRRSGYEQAFVAAFKDNVRTTDPSLFKP